MLVEIISADLETGEILVKVLDDSYKIGAGKYLLTPVPKPKSSPELRGRGEQ
jgi:hypothetical protein